MKAPMVYGVKLGCRNVACGYSRYFRNVTRKEAERIAREDESERRCPGCKGPVWAKVSMYEGLKGDDKERGTIPDMFKL